MRITSSLFFLSFAITLAAIASALRAQEPTAPASSAKPAPAYKPAMKWKRFDYTCEGGEKLTVYLHDQTVKVRFKDSIYLMRQVPSADGGRYSDGKVLWWSVGNTGFLAEDSQDGDGKAIVKDCRLNKPVNGGAAQSSVRGSVTYWERMALPPDAVIEVQLFDISLVDCKPIAEEKITLGDRQVPVPFELKFDPSAIDPKHSYSVSAKITVDGELRFTGEQPSPVLTGGNPDIVEITVKQPAPQNSNKP
jgi:putative lipoprotein